MTNSLSSCTTYPIYPKKYFRHSKTWWHWNKLTAVDVHSLREERGFEGQHIYFYLNNPIEFVRTVGVLVGLDLVGEGRHLILTLDDSSGKTISVKTEVRKLEEGDTTVFASNTLVDNLHATVLNGLPVLRVNRTVLDVGKVIMAKGTIDTFRAERQLRLERISVIADTNAEVKAWAETAAWKRERLSTPWVMTEEEREAIDKTIDADEANARAKVQGKEREKKMHAAKIMQRAERAEKRRKLKEEELNKGALAGSHVVPGQWMT